MTGSRRKNNSRKGGIQPLRKQTPLRKQSRGSRRGRVASSVPAAHPELPRTAARRRRRNRIPFTFPSRTVVQVFTSARWLSLAVLLFILYGINVLATRSDFYLRYIPVEGVVSITADEVVAASGLAGRHVFAVDPNEAARKVAELPGIVSASVSLRWPNRISISIEEDTPIAIWQTPEESYWINEKGELLQARIDVPGLIHIVAESNRGLIGLVSAIETPETPAGEEGNLDPEAEAESGAEETLLRKSIGAIPEDILLGALLLQKLQPTGNTLNQINYHPSNGLSFQDERGWSVFLGTGTDMKAKLAVYEAIVRELEAQGITPQYISVSNLEKPFYMAVR